MVGSIQDQVLKRRTSVSQKRKKKKKKKVKVCSTERQKQTYLTHDSQANEPEICSTPANMVSIPIPRFPSKADFFLLPAHSSEVFSVGSWKKGKDIVKKNTNHHWV